MPDIVPSIRGAALACHCFLCGASPGQPCFGARGQLRASVHAERHLAALNANRQTAARESRYYDQPADIPDGYHDDQPAPPTLIHPLDPDTCERGLRHLAAIRATLNARDKADPT